MDLNMIIQKGLARRRAIHRKRKSDKCCDVISSGTKLKVRLTRKGSICPPPSTPAYQQIEQSLAKISRRIDLISGDGNCLFRALSKEVFGSEKFHNCMRNRIVNLVDKHSRLFDQLRVNKCETMDTHMSRMRMDGTWGTSLEIIAAATLLERKIYIYTPAMKRMRYQWYHYSPLNTRRRYYSYVAICHTRGEHFDRIVPMKEFDNVNYRPPISRGNLNSIICENLSFTDFQKNNISS